ncbi:coiled-coil domain-containing protein 150 [Bombina bombina]|uniref:coiled-coil domain-containing protein 150 n=1 Tax=Bombina bombina TaxID=8345 RepID=UPI00235AAF74|nr:coiled-coil domain-containing protein 150 [Bombina bombina]
MSRPIIAPLNIHATAPETFSVLQQRMRVAEEQAESLISDLKVLGMSGQGFEHLELNYHDPSVGLRPISPVKARSAFIGDNDTLWKNCENLVNRMCRMESLIQTLKLSIFRLHTDQQLNPKNSAELEKRLNEVQEEHAQELKEAKVEVMRLRQRLSDEIEERERELEAKERLSAALEIVSATKTDVAIAAEEMKATNLRMSHRLCELQEQLTQEAGLRSSLEEMQLITLKKVEDMKRVVEAERAQVQDLQQDCQAIHREGQEVKERLQKEEERSQKLEKENIMLHTDLEARNLLIAKLQDETKSIKQTSKTEQANIAQIKADSAALREAAEKIQALNQQLEDQCSELTATVQQLTADKAQLRTEHQQELKAEQDALMQKLHEQELMLNTVKSSLTTEIQRLQRHEKQLENELESLRTEQKECHRRLLHSEQKYSVEREMQESTISCLKRELDTALRGKTAALNERDKLQEELVKSLNHFQEEKQNLEVKLTENKLELGSVQNALQAQGQENIRLMERMAALEQEQHAHKQVEALLTDLTESRNKLAYEKGKLQSTVDQLQSKLQSVCDAQSENSQLRKLNNALEAKYTQVNSEFDSCRIQLQRMEVRLKQAQNMLLHKEEDFTLAIQSRDEALREEKRIRGQMEIVEESGKQNRSALQQQLCDVREEKSRLSETLENVLSSHTQLQKDLEKLQTELGQRDCDITALQKERTQSQKQIQQLEVELSECQARLLHADSYQREQTEQLRRTVERSREDNKKLAHTLEKTMQQCSRLQSHVGELEKDLQRKEVEEQKLKLLREQVEQDAKLQCQQFEEHLTCLKQQHKAKSEEAKKAARREITELKKALEEATFKSEEFSCLNHELRSTVSTLEKAALQYKQQVRRLKTQLRLHIENEETSKRAKKEQETVAELKHLEQVNKEYKKVNKEQVRNLKELLTENSNLRVEIAAASQNEQNNVLQSQLEKETQRREELEEMCKNLEKQMKELQEQKEITEQKLREASVESEQISLSLEEAHNWFHSRFNELQLEIMKNRQGSSTVSPDRSTEEIIPRKLPPQSTVNLWETKQELKLISRNLLPDVEIGPSCDCGTDIES